jgi:TonB-linked SusC/RagA family outer membrane protein
MKLNTAFNKLLSIACLTTTINIANAQQNSKDTSHSLTNQHNETYIGYGTQKDLFNVSSISTNKGAALRKAFTNNISNTFYGRFTGLTTNQGGNEPGVNNANLFIRGANTFGFSSSPLVVIDGFLGDFNELVPEEIEEISVLKDAAATAVYGMRGANGVVVITTKKGKIQPLTVSFGAQYGFQNPTSLPNFLNAYDYSRLYNEALVNDGRTPLYTQADLDAYQNGSDPFFRPNVNWYNEVLRNTAPLANYNLNFRGGNKTARFFAMLNVLSSDGLFKNFGNNFNETSNSRYNRYNFRANVDVTLTKTLSAQLNIGGSVEDKRNPGDLFASSTIGLIDRIAPNAFPVYNPNGSFGVNTTYGSNPIGNLTNTGFSTSNNTTIQSSLRLTQQLDAITPGLSASVAVAFNSFYAGGSHKRKDYVRFGISKGIAGDTIYSNPIGQRTTLSPQEPVLSQYRNYAIQASLNYQRKFGKHDLSGMIFFNTDSYDINRNYPNTDAANQAFPYKTNSVSSRATYVYNEKYIAEVSSSFMGAESFPRSGRYGFFPSVALGWIASNEAFLTNNKLISFLKVRASYGLVGNENIGGQRFAYAQRYPFGASYFLGAANGSVNSISEGRRANNNVTWEKENKLNVGIDVTLAKRISIAIDVFSNKRFDILSSGNGTIPQVLGFNGIPDLNIGKATTNGFEFALKYNNDEKKPLQFFAEAMVSYVKNNIDFNGQAFQPNAQLYRFGHPIDQPFGLRALGLFQSDAEIAASPKPLGIVVRPGDIKYQDIGGPLGVPDGIIDGNDATAIGKTDVPQLTFGFNAGFKYKNFDVNLIFQGVAGVTQYLGGSRYHAFQNDGQINAMALDRWTTATAATATYPRLSINGDQNNYRFSSFWQRDGSFIKLRVAEIGYTFSEKLLKKMRLAETRLFVNGTNLFTIDRMKEGDAEAMYGYPQLRTVSIGFKLQLL